MNRLIAIIGCFLWAGAAVSQTENEALIYSRTTSTGSARAQGMGGAFSAVGADMTAATLNPAGTGSPDREYGWEFSGWRQF